VPRRCPTSRQARGRRPRGGGGAGAPSDDLDYFLSKGEIASAGSWDALLGNYLDKHQALNRTAEALVTADRGGGRPPAATPAAR